METDNLIQQNNSAKFNFAKYKKILIIFSVLIVLIVVFSLININNNQPLNNSTLTPIPNTPHISQTMFQEKFSVLKTTPENGALNVAAGEIVISFTTDRPIMSKNSFSMDINPKLPNYWKITSSFPTNEATAQVYGNLALGTRYVVTVKDIKENEVYTWSFFTSNKPAESSSKLQYEEDKKTIINYYPLANNIPYETSKYSIDYTGRLTLTVKVKSGDLETIKTEVNEWIKSKDISPATHTILYE